MAQNCQKGPKMAHNGPIMSNIVWNSPKLPKMMQNYQQMSLWTVLGHQWSFMVILDHYWPFGPFFHNRSGAYKNDQKLKHDLDYQMSTKMVLENHEDNINTQWNQCEILVYFGSIYTEHPVEGVVQQQPWVQLQSPLMQGDIRLYGGTITAPIRPYSTILYCTILYGAVLYSRWASAVPPGCPPGNTLNQDREHRKQKNNRTEPRMPWQYFAPK